MSCISLLWTDPEWHITPPPESINYVFAPNDYTVNFPMLMFGVTGSTQNTQSAQFSLSNVTACEGTDPSILELDLNGALYGHMTSIQSFPCVFHFDVTATLSNGCRQTKPFNLNFIQD